MNKYISKETHDKFKCLGCGEDESPCILFLEKFDYGSIPDGCLYSADANYGKPNWIKVEE